MKRGLSFLCAVAMSLAFPAAKSFASPSSSATPLQDMISDINRQITTRGLNLRPIAAQEFIEWYNDISRFVPRKDQRRALDFSLLSGELASGFSIDIMQLGIPGFEDRIVFNPFGEAIVEGMLLRSYTAWIDQRCLDYGGGGDLCHEPFLSSLPTMSDFSLPTSIPVRVTHINIQGTSHVPGQEARDGLKVELLVTPQNVEDIVSYFGVGFDPKEQRNRLLAALGDSQNVWIEVQTLFTNWVARKANSFPQGNDNEVCHGPVREFFYAEQDPRVNKATETTVGLLKNHYCLVSDGSVPRFGDYLYVPGMHSGRFILKDPTTGRDIAFSVQSGGFAPYRFWWVDEDFSGYPFAHKSDPHVYETKIDVWRRCR